MSISFYIKNPPTPPRSSNIVPHLFRVFSFLSSPSSSSSPHAAVRSWPLSPHWPPPLPSAARRRWPHACLRPPTRHTMTSTATAPSPAAPLLLLPLHGFCSIRRHRWLVLCHCCSASTSKRSDLTGWSPTSPIALLCLTGRTPLVCQPACC
jgi:hypothetical protein